MKKSRLSPERLRKRNSNQLKKDAAELLASLKASSDYDRVLGPPLDMHQVSIFGHRGFLAMTEKDIRNKLDSVRVFIKETLGEYEEIYKDRNKRGQPVRHYTDKYSPEDLLEDLKEVDKILGEYADIELLSL